EVSGGRPPACQVAAAERRARARGRAHRARASFARMSPAVSPVRRSRPHAAGPSAAPSRFYRRVIGELNAAGVEFPVGGGHALECYLGIGRSVKDLDLFMRERDVPAALRLCQDRLGYGGEVTFPHWLAKITREQKDHIDVIFNSGNGVCAVDDEGFRPPGASPEMG